MRCLDPAVELDVATQVKLIGNIIQVALGLRLSGEMFLPIPFIEQFLGEGIAVCPAFGIEAGAGIAVPIPSTADGGTSLEHPRCHAELAQPVELIKPGDAGTDHDRVEIQSG